MTPQPSHFDVYARMGSDGLPHGIVIIMTLFVKVFLRIVRHSAAVPLNSLCQSCSSTAGLIISLGQLCFTPLQLQEMGHGDR